MEAWLNKRDPSKGKLMFSSEREHCGWCQRKPGQISRTGKKNEDAKC